MQTLKSILPLVIVGALATVAASRFKDLDLAGLILTQPDDIQFVEGKIKRFVPYFHDDMDANPNGDLHRGSPLRHEGVEVIIAFENTDGEEDTFHETWRITAIDHFKRGDLIDVYWEKALAIHPKSVIGNTWNLRTALQHVAHRSAEPGSLRDTQTQRINDALDKRTAYSKHCLKYNNAFHNREPWQRNFVGYANGKRIGYADYQDYKAQSTKRLAVIRQALGITPPQ